MNDLFEYLLAMQKGTGGGGGGEKVQLQTPSIAYANGNVTVTDFDINTTAYEVYIDGELYTTVPRAQPAEITDLANTEWEFNEEVNLSHLGVFSIDADILSEPYPTNISNIIVLEQCMFWSYYFAYGQLNRGDRFYLNSIFPIRVIKANGNIAECLLLQPVGTGIPFSSTNNNYWGSDLDIYLNNTVYDMIISYNIPADTLLDKEIVQAGWYDDNTGTPSYNGTGNVGGSDVPYALSYADASVSHYRKVYAPSIQDILDYIGDLNVADGTLSYYNIWKLFWGDVDPHSSQFWLRDGVASDSTKAWGVSGDYGMLGVSDITETNGVAYAMATLDLSKVDIVIGDGFFANPIKGSIITSDGIDYRVLKTNGRVAELLMLANPLNQQVPFGANNTYEGSVIDGLLNETLYGGLSDGAKAAIVDKTFKQDSWYSELSNPSGDPAYQAIYGENNNSYVLSLGNAEYGEEITRHIYLPSVQDIIDYLGATPEMTQSNTTITKINICEKLFDYLALYPRLWLRSASAADSANAFAVITGQGALDGGTAASGDCDVFPVFQADSSKVAWKLSGSPQPIF